MKYQGIVTAKKGVVLIGDVSIRKSVLFDCHANAVKWCNATVEENKNAGKGCSADIISC